MSKISKPSLGWARVLLIIIPFGFFVGLSQILAMVTLGISMSEKHFHPNTFQAVAIELFMLSGIIAVVAIFRKWVDRYSFKSMGFQLSNFRHEGLVGTLLGMVMIAAGFLLLLAFHQIPVDAHRASF